MHDDGYDDDTTMSIVMRCNDEQEQCILTAIMLKCHLAPNRGEDGKQFRGLTLLAFFDLLCGRLSEHIISKKVRKRDNEQGGRGGGGGGSASAKDLLFRSTLAQQHAAALITSGRILCVAWILTVFAFCHI